MANSQYKTYALESILDLYLNKNGVSYSVNSREQGEGSAPSDDEDIDLQIQKDFMDDVVIPPNEKVEELTKRVKRYQKIVKMLKKRYNYRCQLCGYTFQMDNGDYYCEAHHLVFLSQDGSQSKENVIIVCANHHRKFHYANRSIIVGELIDGIRTIRIGDEEFVVQFQ